MSETNDVTEPVAEVAKTGAEAVAAEAAQPQPKKAQSARPATRKPQRRSRPARANARANGSERNKTMTNQTNNIFAGFGAFPGAAAFEKLFADAAGRSEETVKRSRQAAEEIAETTRANVDAFVEAGRIATSGAQSIGQQVLAKGRDNIEHAANTVRSLAEAKSPADVLQIQSDYVRGAFDRFVEESSNLTESVVKLAGEAFQPISTRASQNVERFNEMVA